MSDIDIAVIGVGVIGKRHIQEILDNEQCRLVAIADPSPEAQSYASSLRVALYREYHELLDEVHVDAVIICTPNHAHVEVAIACIDRGIPVLIEKPIADDLASARKLAEASRLSSVPVLVGHHRRHNPVIQAAKRSIVSGRIGSIVVANIMCVAYKPDAYFDVHWRRRAGGGPILINMIHEIDLVRYRCGEVSSVQAMSSRRTRGHDVEDSAACLLQLESGAICNISLSDTAVAPWNWDTAAGEDRNLFDYRRVPTHFFAGTSGAISLPDTTLWSYPGERGRHLPIYDESLSVADENVYANQLRHFVDVARDDAQPIIDAFDAVQTLAVTIAVVEAARTGRKIEMDALV